MFPNVRRLELQRYPNVPVGAHRTLTQKIAFDRDQGEQIESSLFVKRLFGSSFGLWSGSAGGS
jgi:hypothetical protein